MKLTFADNNRLDECLDDTIKLNEKMTETLVGIIGDDVIRTDNDKDKSTIFAFVFDEDLEHYREEKISAIAVFEGNVVGLLINGNIDLSDVSDDDLLESDDWYSINGGYILINATLYNICENIREYI